MKTFFGRFSFDPYKVDWKMWCVIVMIYLVVAACGVGSVLANRKRFTVGQRNFWIAVIVCLPGVGLLAYLPFSFKREGMGILRQQKKSENKAVKISAQ